jgi:hypothetical protein
MIVDGRGKLKKCSVPIYHDDGCPGLKSYQMDGNSGKYHDGIIEMHLLSSTSI